MQASLKKSGPVALIVVLSTLVLTGCAAGRWFESGRSNPTPSPDTPNSSDPKSISAAYIRSLCALPREQRQPQVRALNEAVLPDNVVISCGRTGLETP